MTISPIQHDKSAKTIVATAIATAAANIRNIDDDSIDLYSDVNIGTENDMELYPGDEFGITGSMPKMNRSDSILDIHTNVDFEEADLQESDSELATANPATNEALFTPMPEPSKWEREDEIGVEKSDYIFQTFRQQPWRSMKM